MKTFTAALLLAAALPAAAQTLPAYQPPALHWEASNFGYASTVGLPASLGLPPMPGTPGNVPHSPLDALTESMLACDICGCGFVTNPLDSWFKPGFQVSIGEQYTHFGQLQIDGHTVGNYGQYLDSSITNLNVNYNITERVGVQLSLPYVNRSYGRPDANGNMEFGDRSGLGDISALVHYMVVRDYTTDHSLSLNLFGGIKLPTGDSSALAEVLDEMDGPIPNGIGGHDIALGTGSVDGQLGTTLFYSDNHFLVTANLQYSIRGAGAYDYQYANDFVWSVAPGAVLARNDKTYCSLALNISGDTKGQDNLAGVKTDDTAATAVYVGPQFTGVFNSRYFVQLSGDIPVYRGSTGVQLLPDWRLRLNLSSRL